MGDLFVNTPAVVAFDDISKFNGYGSEGGVLAKLRSVCL